MRVQVRSMRHPEWGVVEGGKVCFGGLTLVGQGGGDLTRDQKCNNNCQLHVDQLITFLSMAICRQKGHKQTDLLEHTIQSKKAGLNSKQEQIKQTQGGRAR